MRINREKRKKKGKVGRNMNGKKDAKEEIELRPKTRRRQERGATNGERGDERRRNIRKEEKKIFLCEK